MSGKTNCTSMRIYKVGGAVRDRLLGRKIKDCDWVVVGSNPEEMNQLGYRRVGKDFPVYLGSHFNILLPCPCVLVAHGFFYGLS